MRGESGTLLTEGYGIIGKHKPNSSGYQNSLYLNKNNLLLQKQISAVHEGKKNEQLQLTNFSNFAFQLIRSRFGILFVSLVCA